MKPSEFVRNTLKSLWDEYESKGGTQLKLAQASGVAQGQISRWLKGDVLPNIDGLASLAKGFKVPLAAFLPPDGSLLGDIVFRLATLNENELARIRERIDSLIESRSLPSGPEQVLDKKSQP